ncbi:hypothetical protein ACQKMN_07195, partial [Ureibacillus composti]
DIQKVREEIAQESAPFGQGQSFSNQSPLSQPSAGKTMAGTNIQKVREEIAQESAPFSQGQSFSSQPSAGKTMAGTDIQEVRQQNAQAERGKFNK